MHNLSSFGIALVSIDECSSYQSTYLLPDRPCILWHFVRHCIRIMTHCKACTVLIQYWEQIYPFHTHNISCHLQVPTIQQGSPNNQFQETRNHLQPRVPAGQGTVVMQIPFSHLGCAFPPLRNRHKQYRPLQLCLWRAAGSLMHHLVSEASHQDKVHMKLLQSLGSTVQVCTFDTLDYPLRLQICRRGMECWYFLRQGT